METTKNFVQLCGTAAGEPAPSHENHGQQFSRFPLAVRRPRLQVEINAFLT